MHSFDLRTKLQLNVASVSLFVVRSVHFYHLRHFHMQTQAEQGHTKKTAYTKLCHFKFNALQVCGMVSFETQK